MSDAQAVSHLAIDTIMVFRGIIPCLAVILVGYLVGRGDRAEHEKTLSSLIYFVFSPSLVFMGLHRHAFHLTEVVALAAGAVASVALIVPLAVIVNNRRPGSRRSSVLPMLFTSSGTLLLPLAYLLYGNGGLAKAVMFHLFSSLLFYTFGTWFGGEGVQPWRFFRSPSFYAAVVALVSVEFAMPLPTALEGFFRLVERGIDIVAIGALPMLLLSFGYPFCQVERSALKAALPGALVRMLAGPAAALLVILILRFLDVLAVAKGYSILEYIDMRTTEAVILLAGAAPGAISCYLFNRRHAPEASADALAVLALSGLIGIVSVPCTLLVINRFILSN